MLFATVKRFPNPRPHPTPDSRPRRRPARAWLLVLAGSLALAPTAAAAAPAPSAPAATAPTAAVPTAPVPTATAQQTLRGVLEVVQSDRLPSAPEAGAAGSATPPGHLPTRHYLREADGDRVLLTGDVGALEDVATGQAVAVSGRAAATGVEDADSVLQVTAATATAPAPEVETDGSRKVAVVVLRRGPAGREPMSIDQVRTAAFTAPNSVAQFFEQSSFGTLQISGVQAPEGDVIGALEIPADTACWTEADAGAAAAQAAGIDLSAYDYVAYLLSYSTEGCAYGGWAYVGGSVSVTLAEDESSARSILHHEIGHNLGLQHAHALRCTTSTGRWTTVEEGGSTCQVDEYGDPFDSMGDAYNQMQFSAQHKHALGWLPDARVAAVTESGTYTVTASELTTGAVQNLRIPTSGAGFYDVDVRRPVTFWDEKVRDIPALQNGITIRKVDDRGQSVVDTSPDGNMYDAPLQVGKTFTDPNERISITLVRVGETTADVKVVLPEPMPQVYLRGTHNSWGLTKMTPIEGARGQFRAEVRFGSTTTERFKFDVNGDWKENYGDSNRDGLADRSGSDIAVTTGAGTYLVTFDSITRRYTFVRTAFDSIYPSMNLRGTHNQWGTHAMYLTDNNVWTLTVWLGGQADSRVKFDVDGTWGTNFGDSNRDGIADPNGADITVPGGAGLYVVTFDERTRRYSFNRFG